MSFSPYSNYSHITNYGNYEDGAYYLNDGAYDSGNNYNDHLGDNYQDLPPSPEPHTEYQEALTRRAAEYGLTPRRLQELDDECIREQEELEQEERREELIERQRAREYEQEELEIRMEMEMEMEQPGDWLEKHENWVHRGTHTHNTYLKPKQQVDKGYGMADKPPETATSPRHKVQHR